MSKGFWKDASWLELAAIVSLALSLVAITIPKFERFECRSKQSEAKFELAQIHAAQKLHYGSFGRYVSLEELASRSRIKPRAKYYNYQTRGDMTANKFTIEARGKDGSQVAGDIWAVDQDKNIEHEHNACE